jgi:CHAT domain-containing protein
LSACESGLGEIKGSEGVFGLQRSFKMAGVKNIIMSLWKVPDTQTAELFDLFYGYCFEGFSIHKSLKLAQSEMQKKYSPYYWAGFVLLE